MAKHKEILYRTEMSDDAERNAVDVMFFEIYELNNTDILDYVSENYNLPNILKENIQTYIDNVDDIDSIDDGGDGLRYMLNEILGCIEDETGVTINYAYWLAGLESVNDNYEGEERTVYGYDITNGVRLSDLGYDGELWGFQFDQEPCEEIEPDFDEDDEEYDEFDDVELTDEDLAYPDLTTNEIDNIVESGKIDFNTYSKPNISKTITP